MKKTLLNSIISKIALAFYLSIFSISTSLAQAYVTFTTNTTYTIPAGVTSIQVEAWGGGGAGGGCFLANTTGGGGGGGAYRKQTISVIPGNNYNIVVGTGGTGGSGIGPAGSSSIFGASLVVANGGGGGGATIIANSGGAAGIGATGGLFNGGNGAAGTGTTSGGGGGAAGSLTGGQNAISNNGGLGGLLEGGKGGNGRSSAASAGVGSAGATYGAGGGGAKNTGSATARNGGNGANGFIRIALPCATPSAQPTALTLTAGPSFISGSFTAAAGTEGYLVIRTTSATAPSNPVDGTVYAEGTNALGGYVESVGYNTTFLSSGLNASTRYWFWIFSLNTKTCININYLNTSPLAGNMITTGSCGSIATNTAVMPESGSVNWTALPWSLGHVPLPCENVIVTFTGTTGSNNTVTLNITSNIAIKNLTLINNSTTLTNAKVFKTVGAAGVSVLIDGDLNMSAPGALSSDSCTLAVTDKITINGDAVLGEATDNGFVVIGSTGSTADQTWIFKGDITFNIKSYTLEEHTIFIMDGTGTQTITNNTSPTLFAADCLLFDIFKIGGGINTPRVVFAGTNEKAFMNDKGGYLEINSGATLALPQNFTFNAEDIVTTGKFLTSFVVKANAILEIGGDAGGQTGSNFPLNYPALTLHATSTVNYNGSNSITQTIFNGVTYGKLLITNGSGSGRASKQTTAGTLNIGTSLSINALADLYLGTATGLGSTTSPVTCSGPLNILSTGGLYCNANVVSGASSFSMASGSFLGLGSAAGITTLGNAAGNISMTTARSYSNTGNYIYNGIVNQVTGNGLPTVVNDLTIDNSNIVTLTAPLTVNGTNLLKQGILDVLALKVIMGPAGILNSVSGKMKANAGTLEMAGTNGVQQGLAPKWFVGTKIATLINNNTVGITIAAPSVVPPDTLLISNALTYGANAISSQIITNDNLTFLSNKDTTARFGAMISPNSITGKVNVERYLPTTRKWRHLAWPTNSTQTARQSWMENNTVANGNIKPGYGTIVTDEKTTWNSNSFDSRSISGPSVKYYDPVSNTQIGIPNTTTYQMNSRSAYFNYVRGDRSCLPSPYTTSATILRSTGTLKTGNITFPVTANLFAAIGNPYASAIDIRKLDTVNLTSVIYVWDPKLTGAYGLGAYQMLYVSGADYRVMPGGGSYGNLNSLVDTLESGQAFFIKARTSNGSITFKETAKNTGARTMSRMFTDTALFSVLSLITPTENIILDGAMTMFGEAQSNGVDDNDASKISNTGENLSFKRNTENLAIEKRANIIKDDTLFLNMAAMRVNKYKLDLMLYNLSNQGRKGFLIDKFLNSETALNLNDTTSISFDVINTLGSYASDRFMIVFKQIAIPSTKIISLNAERKVDNSVTIKWNINEENCMDKYVVEYSIDGENFNAIGDQTPTANNFGNVHYIFNDIKAAPKKLWYRITGIAVSGYKIYSNIQSVDVTNIVVDSKPTVSIYPNPVTDGNVNVYFNNELQGKFDVRIINNSGQIILNESFNVNSANFVKHVKINAASGLYKCIITDEKNLSRTISFIIK